MILICKSIVILGLLILTVRNIYLSAVLVYSVRNTSTSQDPPPNFSLKLLRNYEDAWIRYGNGANYQKSNAPCPEVGVPPGLSRVKVKMDSLSFEDLSSIHTRVKPGGHWYPEDCTAQFRTAIIVPYRNREEHLRTFLHNIHPFLQTQNIDYAVFVVEQKGHELFNKGMLMNIGFTEARKVYDWQCYVFHDVDMLPEDIRNFYTCPGLPRHLSSAIDKYDYKMLYGNFFGGVTVLTKQQFLDTNGYSNLFRGWGGEDDDFRERTNYANLKFERAPMDVGRYKMIEHEQDNPKNPDRVTLIGTGQKRYKNDGVNSLKYDLIRLEPKKLFTWVYVNIDDPS